MTITTPILNSTARRFNETHNLLRRFVILPDTAAYDIATLWVMHTHVRDSDDNYAFDYTPRIAFLSDGPSSGKTVALDKVALLSNRGIRTSNVTAPAVTSMISTEKLIPCIDEIDELFGKTSASKSDLRAVLNAGYERGGMVARAANRSEVFGPVAFAGMGANFANNDALRALRSRTIAIWMRPKEVHEQVEIFRRRFHEGQFNAHNRNLALWGKANVLSLIMSDPDMPDGIENRDIDLWAPLLSIAELAGDDIAERGRNALLQYAASVTPANSELTDTDRLIVALVSLFNDASVAEMPTQDIIPALFDMDNGSWRKRWNDNPIAASRGIADMLSTIGVSVHRMRVTDPITGQERQVRGYEIEPMLPYVPEGYGPSESEQDDLSDLPEV